MVVVSFIAMQCNWTPRPYKRGQHAHCVFVHLCTYFIPSGLMHWDATPLQEGSARLLFICVLVHLCICIFFLFVYFIPSGLVHWDATPLQQPARPP